MIQAVITSMQLVLICGWMHFKFGKDITSSLFCSARMILVLKKGGEYACIVQLGWHFRLQKNTNTVSRSSGERDRSFTQQQTIVFTIGNSKTNEKNRNNMEKNKNGPMTNGILRTKTAKRLFSKQSGSYSNVWALQDAPSGSPRRKSSISLWKKGEIQPSQYPRFI